ncbi:MAG: DUF1934 domain-containing protein [Oscillospiraceae bacterium]|nr:DUF1934 domain-containing protein [Oscillospiraceae bacterium]
MEEKNVIIELHSVHAYDRDDSESFDFSTDGTYRFEDGVGRLSYWESAVTGLPGTRTSVAISPLEIVVDREGTVTSRMEFREGKRNTFQYQTPFGMADVRMNTHRLRADFNEHGGDAELDYVLDLEHTVAVRNRFHLKVTEMTGEERYG